jgi:hypothetical protein
MRISVLGDDGPTTLEASVVDESTDVSVPGPNETIGELTIPDDITELAESPEYLVIGPPPQSAWVHVLHGAAIAIVAAVLITWLLSTNPDNQTEPIAPSPAAVPPWAPAQPEPAIVVPDQAEAGSNVGSLKRPATHAQFCRNSPVLCSSPATPLPIGYLQFCHNTPTLCIMTKPN